MANSLYKTCLQGIMVVVFIIWDWIFVLMNTTTMIPFLIEGMTNLSLPTVNLVISEAFFNFSLVDCSRQLRFIGFKTVTLTYLNAQ